MAELKQQEPQVFGRVAVLMGGHSAEREISLLSGKAVSRALLNRGIDVLAVDLAEQPLMSLPGLGVDRVFIMLHGKVGEDGTVQGALEMMGLPYTGSGVLASALAMDKVRAKKIWLHDGLPTPAFQVVDATTEGRKLIETLGTVFVKPVKEGSSLGISRAATEEEFVSAFREAGKYDSYVIAEQWIEGREFSVPVLGEQVLPAIEMKTDHAFYDYEAKYFSDDTRYICPCELSDEKRAELETLCLQAYRTLGCEGWGRVDVMQDKNGKFWLLEVNTVPGMTEHSLVPMGARAAGMSFEDLVVAILRGTLDKTGVKVS